MVAAERGFLAQHYVGSALNTFVLIAALTYYSFRLVEHAEAQTEGLLDKILPSAVTERLREHPKESIADAFEHASILFRTSKLRAAVEITGREPRRQRCSTG